MASLIKKRPKTIFRKLLFQITLVVLLQAILFGALFFGLGVISKIDENAYNTLTERVVHEASDLEDEMVRRWSSFQFAEYAIISQVESILEQNDAAWSDIKKDPTLDMKITKAVAEDIILLLRRNAVTGAFLILDGPGMLNQNAWQYRTGFYVRDLDPDNSPIINSSDSDLLIERGPASISKSLDIPLDSRWRAGFYFSKDEQSDNEQFFSKPYRAALAGKTLNSKLYGYWSRFFSLSGDDGQVLTYSVPLIAPDGAVFGVLGIDLTQSYLLSYLDYNELYPDKSGTYILGTTQDGGKHINVVASSGVSYRSLLEQTSELIKTDVVYDNVVRLEIPGSGSSLLGSIKNLNLYSANSAHKQEQWVLIGAVNEDVLLAFPHQVRSLIFWAMAMAMVLGLLGATVISRKVTKPIITLVTQLKKSNPERAISLQKLDIAEIDQLTTSIEDLSCAVAESASKISKILAMTNARIGVFEHVKEAKVVFCSRFLMELTGWGSCGKEYCYLDAEEFYHHMEQLVLHREEGENNIYKLPSASENTWLQIHTVEEEGEILGTVMDVTQEMLQKHQLAYERDYDLLTNLYNRRGFQEHAQRLLQCPDKMKIAALAMWDMDNLKFINDTYGHNVGDDYIQAFSQCLRAFEHQQCITARRSGDEFYALIYGLNSKESAREIVSQICQEIRRTTILLPTGDLYRLRASCGMTWYPTDAILLEDLMRYADFAMYQVKHSHKGELQEFNRLLYENNALMLNGQEAFNSLIDQALIDYAMQPILCAKTGQIYGYEMLMRPRGHDFSSPRDVLRVASSQSQLCRVERLTWFGAMQTFVKCLENDTISPDTRVFINSISSCNLSTADMAAFERQFSSHLDQVVLEITQGDPSSESYLQEKFHTASRWNALVAIDDYGMNDNSEVLLSALSPHLVKIGMSMTRKIDTNLGHQKLLDGLVTSCRARGIQVVAEGVETQEEMTTLIRHGVDYLQGYYIALPSMPPMTPSKEVLEQIAAAQKSR